MKPPAGSGVRDLLRAARDGLRALDRSPGPDRTARAFHHGFRALVVVVLAALVPLLFPRGTLPEFAGLEEGEVADRDIIAQVPFAVHKSEAQLASERREAEAGVPPIFRHERAASDTAAARVGAFFSRLDSAAAAAVDEGGAADTAGLRRVLAAEGVTGASAEQLAFLADADRRERLRRTLQTTLRELLSDGVAMSSDLAEVYSRDVRLRQGERVRLLPRDSLRTMGDFYQRAVARAPSDLPAEGLQLYQTLLVRHAVPTLRLDRDATRQAREQARSAVEASAGYVLQGERIVTAHERVGSAEMDKLRAYRARLQEEGLLGSGAGLWRGLGAGLYGLLLLGLLGGALLLFWPELYRDARSYVTVFLLAFLVLAAAAAIGRTGSPAALVPVAFAALLVGALFEGGLAVLVVMVLAALVMGQPGLAGMEAPFLAAVAGGTAALAIREVRRRSQSWILIAVIAGAYVAGGGVLFLLGELEAMEVLGTAMWGGVNATASTALALGAALPALEAFTGRTSDQTLLELADLNRPLLRRLSREAPGTYAHSINVANLAEAACLAIGADALLARVGVYYHDIGKMTRPQYFIENQPKGLNPHDRLRPSESAEIIREHVREGLRLADEANLPEVIKDFIREHHGTQRIAYFYARAQEEEPNLEVNPADFCYPGPKPQTRETAVVLLADAVESASRTLTEPTPERIHALIDRLVQERLEEDQLDECLLTMRNLDVVKSQFARVLTGLYHRRIDYPSPRPRGAPGGEPGAPRAASREAASAAPTAAEGRAVDAGSAAAIPEPAADDEGRPPAAEGRAERVDWAGYGSTGIPAEPGRGADG